MLQAAFQIIQAFSGCTRCRDRDIGQEFAESFHTDHWMLIPERRYQQIFSWNDGVFTSRPDVGNAREEYFIILHLLIFRDGHSHRRIQKLYISERRYHTEHTDHMLQVLGLFLLADGLDVISYRGAFGLSCQTRWGATDA